MKSQNILYTNFWLFALFVLKDKNIIYTRKPKITIIIIPNNVYVIDMTFKKDNINV